MDAIQSVGVWALSVLALTGLLTIFILSWLGMRVIRAMYLQLVRDAEDGKTIKVSFG